MSRTVLVALVGAALVASACSTAPGAAVPGRASVAVAPSSGCAHPVGAAAGAAVAPGRETTLSLQAGPVHGSYELSVPKPGRGRRPRPLILLFYGFDSDPAAFSALTGLPARGAAAGYLVAVPHHQAGESEWQFGGHGTDAAFVAAMVASIERRDCVDRRAVFAAGFSAGAAFTLAYACSHQNQIAAITTVAVEFEAGCTRPLPILAFHGTDDPLIPYRNGAIGLSLPGIKVRGTERNMGDWARLDHCRPGAPSIRIGSQVVRQQWSGCRRGTEVILYSVLGGGHTWPGADPARAIGLTTDQVSATALALSFFASLHR
jgi:polyhydroxybutyrate depolymerase